VKQIMADYSREEVLEKAKKGESLERADLRDVALNKAQLENANLRRADLGGVSLEESNLKNANLSNANLRDAYLAHADLEGANLQKADLESANLEGANLQNADLSRANLEGASLQGAQLSGARLNFAQLELANLGGAILDNVQFTNADLRDAYLGGANLLRSDLQHAFLQKANLEEADLTDADLRDANLKGANLTRTILTGAKLYGVQVEDDKLSAVFAEWVDFSEAGNGEEKVFGDALVAQYKLMKSGGAAAAPAPAASDQAKRFFGKGDVLRNATLEFGDESIVEIESRFENCAIALAPGAVLTLGKHGILQGCQVVGFGEIVIQGEFRENGKGPGIVGPKRLTVRKDGVVVSAVQQAPHLTEFSFEQGCRLRMKIQK
jgi:uncharacterized protein YjbI with pentapeptide repeats